MKVVIIGGVAGGATAAARLRRLDESASIVMLEKSGYVSYANCGLPYYIGGTIEDADQLTLHTPESLRRRFAIDVRVDSEAISIDPAAHTVLVRHAGATYVEHYDQLILAPGAAPIVPDIPGARLDGVFTLRTVEDTLAIDGYIGTRRPRRAAVLGGGFIGLEMVESLKNRGIAVTLLQRSDHVLPPLDGDMAAIVHQYLGAMGVDLRLNARVTGLAPAHGRIQVALDDQAPIEADMVILAVGVQPENRLAKTAGLALGAKGAIVVDEHMRCSAPNIYAVGDAVQVRNRVSGAYAVIPLAGPANKQGRIAADNICGIPSAYHGSQGSSILKLFAMAIATTGLNARAARAAGLDFDWAVIGAPDHAAYYPGAQGMTMKVLFEKPGGRILGAQIVGLGGVDKRIDVLATAIRAAFTAYDLAQLDLAYAPPYASAKDPVNMAGFVMENLLTGKVRQVHWPDLAKLGAICLVDTRTAREYVHGHVPGAVNLPLDELRGSMHLLNRDAPVYLYCQSGLRSYAACRLLTQYGFHCYNLSGGYGFYQSLAAGGALAVWRE